MAVPNYYCNCSQAVTCIMHHERKLDVRNRVILVNIPLFFFLHRCIKKLASYEKVDK